MNYPIWDLGSFTGGQMIALISVLHVYISHLAVGGGLFIFMLDLKGFKENDSEIHKYLKKHTTFFLLLTMVFGGVTGVGIWFIIGLVNPAGTSALIHEFVFGWAIEWVFFVGEIVALILYYYNYDRLNRKNRLTLAFLYFLFAWLSLFIINGILSFMLSPGAWIETGGFWTGFFNPTYFPSLLFRTAMSIMIAGIFGILTTVFLTQSDFRTKMLRYSTKWVIFPALFFVLFGAWYYYSVPEFSMITNFKYNSELGLPMMLLVASSIAVVVLSAYYLVKTPKPIQIFLAFILVFSGVIWMGGFEYSREYARKPYVITDFIYSNSIFKSDVENINKSGFLNLAKWTKEKEVNEENMLNAGKEIFKFQCASCHTVGGTRNDILPRTEAFTYNGMISQLTGQGKVLTYMPEFFGTNTEKEALAAYIIKELHGKELIKEFPAYDITEFDVEIPKFDPINDDYTLLAWNDLGMHCISDCSPWFIILPPANTLEAQLIKRGAAPQIIKSGVKMTYEVEPQHANPSKFVKFWDYAEVILGAKLERNVGIKGKGMNGEMEFNADMNSYQAHAIPVVPYREDGKYNPYPLFTIKAFDEKSGDLLAQTAVTAPTSTEMGCRNCHGGEWRVEGVSGVADETAINILKAHDKNTGTTLYKDAMNGKPQMCASCHPDAATGMPGKEGLMSLSASLHSWHANYMHFENEKSCVSCHPSSESGNTRCSRGVHNSMGLVCTDCHGQIQEHAMALLKSQDNQKHANWMIKNLTSVHEPDISKINPRKAWLNEPECTNCHVDYKEPAPNYPNFNKWQPYEELFRIRTDMAGMRCIACHHSPHAVYPTANPYGKHRDNLQPMQYAGNPYPIGSESTCATCHKQMMPYSLHHENMIRPFRNTFLFEPIVSKK